MMLMRRNSANCACGSGAVTRRIGSLAKKAVPFRHRKHVAGEAEAAQIIDQVLAKAAGALEPGDLRVGETQGFKKIQRLLEAGGEQESAPRRQRPDEQLEYRGIGVAMIQIGLDHGELVEVRQQRTGCRFHWP